MVVEGDCLGWVGFVGVDVQRGDVDVGDANAGLLEQREERDGAAVGLVVRLEVDDEAGQAAGGWEGRHGEGPSAMTMAVMVARLRGENALKGKAITRCSSSRRRRTAWTAGGRMRATTLCLAENETLYKEPWIEKE